MRRALKIIGIVVVVLIGVPIVVIVAVGIALNTGAGRDFAAREIGSLTGGEVTVTRLSGHFPAYVAAGRIAISDRRGVYLTIDDAVLRWSPLALIHGVLDVSDLTAKSVDMRRLPVPAPKKKKPSHGSYGLPVRTARIGHLAIGRLSLAKPVIGEAVALRIAGHATATPFIDVRMVLNATSLKQPGRYRIDAELGPRDIAATLDLKEPAGGMIGTLAGIAEQKSLNGPLDVTATLKGPRDDAALDLTAALGALHTTATGTVDLSEQAPGADVTLAMPDIAPYAALGHRTLAGRNVLRLVASHHGSVTKIHLNDAVDITGGEKPYPALIGKRATLEGDITLDRETATIHRLTLDTAALTATLAGTLAKTSVSLHGTLNEPDIALIDPQLTGHVGEAVTIAGPRDDLSLETAIDGVVTAKGLKSGPFHVAIAMAHLPRTPSGTVKGSGILDGAPLAVDAGFARDAQGGMSVDLHTLSWKSLTGSGAIVRAPGAVVPDGTLHLAIARLADFGALLNMSVAGSVKADFAHRQGQPATLALDASGIREGRSIAVARAKIDASIDHVTTDPAIDATASLAGIRAPSVAGSLKLTAKGTETKLAVTVDGAFSDLAGKPAKLTLAGDVDGRNRIVRLTALTAAARGVTAKLLGPAEIDAKPGFAVKHLALGLGGLGGEARIAIDGRIRPKLDLTAEIANLPAGIARAVDPELVARGMVNAKARLSGTLDAPRGTIDLAATGMKLASGPTASLPPASLTAHETLLGKSARGTIRLGVGKRADLVADGTIPLTGTGPIDLAVTGRTDLRLIDPVTEAEGTRITGMLTPDLHVRGTVAAPQASGRIALADGSVENVTSGLNLTRIGALVTLAGDRATLDRLSATAGKGTITGHGTAGLTAPMPVAIEIAFNHASPVTSDIVTETLGGHLRISGAVKTGLAVGGTIDIEKADIQVPHGLPPSVAKLTIIRPGDKPPSPPAPSVPIGLDLTVNAGHQVFIRGDGIFANLGGSLHLAGTSAHPVPSGGFHLIRGQFDLGGKTLTFTKGTVKFNGGGFMPALDLEASSAASDGTVSTLAITGTPVAPKITLSSNPPLPSDEVLAHLLYGTGTQNLSPFQAASLAASLAQLAGIGGVGSPLGGVRKALGLDELSIGGGGKGSAPSINAGRYVTPGVYVGVGQSASGQGTSAKVEINLYKGLKLKTEVGSGGGSGGNSQSVGLIYQFNY
ncbi:MAG TPA: translocation/assembly module TamB domain-containing protein [Acidiphilium sp.]